MKRITITAAILLLCISLPSFLAAAKVEIEGRAWLDAQKDPAAINVNGAWNSDEWGSLFLTQSEGGRDVSGNGGGYDLTGVVSGERLFMLFSINDIVQYCATLSANGDTILSGTYSSRKSRVHSGLCQEKSRPMNMTKK